MAERLDYGGELTGKVAIVTGANSGIGVAIAWRLGRDGAAVLLTARNAETLQEVAQAVRAAGGTAEWKAQDLAAPDCGEKLVEATVGRFGRIDIVVTRASATKNAPFLIVTDAEWVRGFETKVFGAIRLCRAAWPELVRNRGNVVQICGIGPRTPRDITAMSSLLSAPLYAPTKVLADLGLKDGVHVNAVNPGPVYTPRLKAQMATWAAESGITRQQMGGTAQELRGHDALGYAGGYRQPGGLHPLLPRRVVQRRAARPRWRRNQGSMKSRRRHDRSPEMAVFLMLKPRRKTTHGCTRDES